MSKKCSKEGLMEGLDYKLKDNGLIDWRGMIPAQYFVPHTQWFQSRNLTVPKSTDGLTDKQLLILLDGIKYVANLRGYHSVEYPKIVSTREHCTAVCRIQWKPNCDDPDGKVFSSIGDATPDNTMSFAKFYLGAIAENRAFVRCVRNSLGIEVTGADEIGRAPEEDKEESTANKQVQRVYDKIVSLMDIYDYDFEDIRGKLESQGVKGADKFKKIEDVPKNVIDKVLKILKSEK